MRAAERAVNHNEIRRKKAGWEKKQAQSRQRNCEWEMSFWVKKLISTEPGCGLNSDTTDLWNLGVIPTHGSSKTTGLVLPGGSASIHFPRSSKPNSLADSWTFTPYHEGKLRFDCAWNLRPRANRHKITARRGDGDLVKNLCLAPQGGTSSLLAIASKCSFTPKGANATPIYQL